MNLQVRSHKTSGKNCDNSDMVYQSVIWSHYIYQLFSNTNILSLSLSVSLSGELEIFEDWFIQWWPKESVTLIFVYIYEDENIYEN